MLDGYRGYVMKDDYVGCTALGTQASVEHLRCLAHARRKFVDAQKVQPKGKTGRTDIALNLINKLFGIEHDLKDGCDEDRKADHREFRMPVLAQIKSWVEKTQSHSSEGLGQSRRLPGEQLEQTRAVCRVRLLADRQQCRRTPLSQATSQKI